MKENSPGIPRLSRAAMAGAVCVVLFVAVMLWWLVDPDLADDWFAAPSPWQGRFESYIRPAGFAGLIAATCLGWMAVRTIRHSSGRRYGLALAVFDGLLLPLLGVDMVILFLWALADKALASWRGLDGSMFRNLGEFALWAMLMGTTEDGFNRAPRTRDVAVARSKAQTAELDETTLGILYANASTNSGFLADQRLAGMEVLRARGEAWSYGGGFGSGSGRGGLRLTDKNHVIQLGARYHVSHQFPGAPSPVTAEISYQGEAPPLECARAFMVPFMRDGRDVYLVIAFEVK